MVAVRLAHNSYMSHDRSCRRVPALGHYCLMGSHSILFIWNSGDLAVVMNASPCIYSFKKNKTEDVEEEEASGCELSARLVPR